MNDEIKEAAEKYAKRMWGDHKLVPVFALTGAYLAGADQANEKCQEEIKRLREDLRFCFMYANQELREWTYFDVQRMDEINKYHNLGLKELQND